MTRCRRFSATLRSMPRLLIAVVSLAALLSCGPPDASDPCDQPGFICADNDTALECRSGADSELRWVELPCRGPGGCAKQGDTVSCDVSANVEGDACASTAEGDGLCAEGGTAVLTCVRGVLTKSSTCSACSVSDERVVCQP